MGVSRHEAGRARFAFTDRLGGVSEPPFDELNLGNHVGDVAEAVAENRRLAAKELGLDPASVAWMSQVHGNTVATVDGPPAGPAPTADALVAATPDVALAVLVADCTPVLLADPDAGVIAAAHAGRLGLARGVVPATVTRMVELGARAERIVALTGPAICGGCYEVPAAMRAEVAALAPDAHAVTRAGTPGLDIPAGVWGQLRAAAVGLGEKSHTCTLESADHFSYRRASRTGRLAGYVWLTS